MTTTDRGTASPALLLARSAVVAGVALLLGTVAHTTAGGLIPDAATMIAIGLMLIGATIPMLAGPAGYLRIAALVGGGQMLVHIALTATAGHAGTAGGAVPRLTPAPVLSRHGGVRDALTVGTPLDASGSSVQPHLIDHLLADASGSAALMTAGHFAAAAALAFWLWRGEQALWTLIALLVRRWLRLPVAVAAPLPAYRARLVRSDADRPAPRRTPIPSISRRGPPALAFV